MSDHTRWLCAAAAWAVMTLALGCSQEGKTLGTVVAEVEGMASDTMDVEIALSELMGKTDAKLLIAAKSLPAGTMVKAQLLSGVMKQGPMPVTGKSVNLTPTGLAFSKPAMLTVPLPAPAAGQKYQVITAKEEDEGWTVVEDAQQVPSDGSSTMEWSGNVAGGGLWGMAEVPANSRPPGGG